MSVGFGFVDHVEDRVVGKKFRLRVVPIFRDERDGKQIQFRQRIKMLVKNGLVDGTVALLGDYFLPVIRK